MRRKANKTTSRPVAGDGPDNMTSGEGCSSGWGPPCYMFELLYLNVFAMSTASTTVAMAPRIAGMI